ncbi:hypothetical protein ABIA22_003203 [Sinorhizobium fredii]|uniref:hypothetical protein n=1 Tax=Rhizobium fredii TaxID=380 RepID=UPI0035130432
MLAEDHGINFDWDGTFCEIHMSDEVGYILEVRPWCHGRFVYMVDKVHPYDNDVPDITLGQSHEPTEGQAREEAEKAFLRHLGGGPVVVQ